MDIEADALRRGYARVDGSQARALLALFERVLIEQKLLFREACNEGASLKTDALRGYIDRRKTSDDGGVLSWHESWYYSPDVSFPEGVDPSLYHRLFSESLALLLLVIGQVKPSIHLTAEGYFNGELSLRRYTGGVLVGSEVLRPHTDFGLGTLVLASGPGLQVRTSETTWQDVWSGQREVLFFVGDSLADGHSGLAPIIHRVVGSSEDRIAAIVFLHPKRRLVPL